MVRPKKPRHIRKDPTSDYFKPRGIMMRDLEEVNLTKEEYESIRLKDVLGYDQNKCADFMNISQPTYSRVLDIARKKVADSIINGKALRIEGGSFKKINKKFKCFSCGNMFDINSGSENIKFCIKCNSKDIRKIN